MWNRSKAAEAINALGLAGRDQELALYWLSLWSGDLPPSRDRFEPRKLKAVLPGLALVDFHYDQGPICRLAGTAIEFGLGRSLAGTNLLLEVPPDQRPIRRARLQAIVGGSISLSKTNYGHGSERQGISGIQLPLFGTSENGSRQYLVHTNWRPDRDFSSAPQSGTPIGAPDEFISISFDDSAGDRAATTTTLQTASATSDPKTDEPRHRVDKVSLDEVYSPILRAGIAYWRKLCGARPYPTRQEIRPRDIKQILRNTMLLRVIGDCEDYEFRILGDAHVEAHGFRIVPRRLSQMDDHIKGYSTILKSLYDPVVRTRQAYAMRGMIENASEFPPYVASECVFLPVGREGHGVDHVLNFTVYNPTERFDVGPAD